MATEFLSSTQETSGTINAGGSASSGNIIIAFFGQMHYDEKWQIEMAESSKDDADKEWVAVHSTDFLQARANLGTTVAAGTPANSGTAPTSAPYNLWQGPRNDNRVFDVPTAEGFEYRVRLVWKNNASTSLTNTTVTACWSEGTQKDWVYRSS